MANAMSFGVFAQDGGIEFGGLRWWAAQSGGLRWWDCHLLHQIMQRKSKRRSSLFLQISSPLFQFPFIIESATIITKEKLI